MQRNGIQKRLCLAALKTHSEPVAGQQTVADAMNGLDTGPRETDIFELSTEAPYVDINGVGMDRVFVTPNGDALPAMRTPSR